MAESFFKSRLAVLIGIGAAVVLLVAAVAWRMGAFDRAQSADADTPSTPAAACYWLEDTDPQAWRLMPQYSTIEECYAQDSCNGGLGQSEGGCYKWAEGADAPELPWP